MEKIMAKTNLLKSTILGLCAAGALMLSGCGNSSTPSANADNPDAAQSTQAASTDSNSSGGFFSKLMPSKPEPIVIPAGTSIAVRLQNAVSSASAHPGDTFDAVLVNPLVIDGKTVAPAGAPATGRVVAVRNSGRLHDSGYIRLALATVEVNGKQVPVQSSSIFAAGASHKNRNLGFIGGGAAGGALIGALAGGGKGALIGSAVGAGAGTGAAYATGKKDVGFGAERTLTFRLTQAITVQS
jgi:hypothetical protein